MVDLFAPICPRVEIPDEYCGNRAELEDTLLEMAREICASHDLTLEAVICGYVNNHCRVVVENVQDRRVVGTGDCFEQAMVSIELVEVIPIGVRPEGDE